MKKFIVITIPALLFLGACGGSSKTETDSLSNEEKAEVIWTTQLTKEDRSATCGLAELLGKEGMISRMTEGSDGIEQDQAEAMFSVIEKEC